MKLAGNRDSWEGRETQRNFWQLRRLRIERRCEHPAGSAECCSGKGGRVAARENQSGIRTVLQCLSVYCCLLLFILTAALQSIVWSFYSSVAKSWLYDHIYFSTLLSRSIWIGCDFWSSQYHHHALSTACLWWAHFCGECTQVWNCWVIGRCI